MGRNAKRACIPYAGGCLVSGYVRVEKVRADCREDAKATGTGQTVRKRKQKNLLEIQVGFRYNKEYRVVLSEKMIE